MPSSLRTVTQECPSDAAGSPSTYCGPPGRVIWIRVPCRLHHFPPVPCHYWSQTLSRADTRDPTRAGMSRMHVKAVLEDLIMFLRWMNTRSLPFAFAYILRTFCEPGARLTLRPHDVPFCATRRTMVLRPSTAHDSPTQHISHPHCRSEFETACPQAIHSCRLLSDRRRRLPTHECHDSSAWLYLGKLPSRKDNLCLWPCDDVCSSRGWSPLLRPVREEDQVCSLPRNKVQVLFRVGFCLLELR